MCLLSGSSCLAPKNMRPERMETTKCASFEAESQSIRCFREHLRNSLPSRQSLVPFMSAKGLSLGKIGVLKENTQSS